MLRPTYSAPAQGMVTDSAVPEPCTCPVFLGEASKISMPTLFWQLAIRNHQLVRLLIWNWGPATGPWMAHPIRTKGLEFLRASRGPHVNVGVGVGV